MASEAGLGRGLFVPEGQLRVARHEVPGSDAESSDPEGWPKSLSVPEIFVSKPSPGMSERQRVECSCRLETPGIPVER
jgi:hypothetical protein